MLHNQQKIKVLSFVCLFIFMLFSIRCSIVNAEGSVKYKYVIDKIEKNLDNGDIMKLSHSVEKNDNGDALISGDMETLIDLDDSFTATVSIRYKKDGANDFAEMFHIGRTVCVWMKGTYKKYFHEKLKDHGEVPHPDLCPLPKGNYHFKNYIMDPEKFGHFLRPGQYEVVVTLKKNDEQHAELLKYTILGHTEKIE